jgi:hypothetical protein
VLKLLALSAQMINYAPRPEAAWRYRQQVQHMQARAQPFSRKAYWEAIAGLTRQTTAPTLHDADAGKVIYVSVAGPFDVLPSSTFEFNLNQVNCRLR